MQKFFRTGFTTNNSISLSGGNENIQSYFSYANVYSQGITPQNDYRSHNLNSKVGFNILKDIHIDFTAKFTNQHITNQAAAGYLWNPLTGVYLFLEEKTGMAIKRTSRYMIPQEAAMSKTGQIHNNSNSVIHIGC